MNTRFLTLMQREWLQHRTGWLLLMVLPALLLLGLGLMEPKIQISSTDPAGQAGELLPLGDGITSLRQLPPLMLTLLLTVVAASATLAFAVLALFFELLGLARRDEQDGSIAFWRALPVSDSQSLGTTLLCHLLALPWAAFAAGLAGGLLATLVLVSAFHGLWAWLSQPWLLLLPAVLALLLRTTVGLVLAVGWMLPLLLGTMLASAAVRGWGVPLLGATLLLGTKLLDPQLPAPLVQQALSTMSGEALQALTSAGGYARLHINSGQSPQALLDMLQRVPAAFWHDGLAMLQRAASPGFALALAAGAACFAGLVALRQRSL